MRLVVRSWGITPVIVMLELLLNELLLAPAVLRKTNSLRDLAIQKCLALLFVAKLHLKMNPGAVFQQAHPNLAAPSTSGNTRSSLPRLRFTTFISGC